MAYVRHPAVLALLGRFALRLGSDIFKTMPLLTKIIMANWDVQVMLRTLPFGRALRFLPVLFGKPLQNRRKDIDPLNA